MIWVLRHIGVHLWVSTLLAVPVSFLLMPISHRFFPSASPVLIGLIAFVGILILLAVLMDMTARHQISSLIREGQAWERSGLLDKAGKRYIRAVRVYDTYLLWPGRARKSALAISRAIAGFQLSTRSSQKNMKLATATYLKINPGDADIAASWLSQIRSARVVSTYEQEVLSLLAKEHGENSSLYPVIASLFLDLHRTDYIADRLYQKVLERPDLSSEHQRIKALAQEDGPAAMNRPIEIQPRKEIKKQIRKTAGTAQLLSNGFSRLSGAVHTIVSFIGGTACSVARMSAMAAAALKNSRKIRGYLKTGVITLAAAGLLFFMISTLRHNFENRAVKKPDAVIEAAVPKPFTIQVAAYLKQSHADRYLTVLKKKGIEAEVRKVDGGGKTWFVVRVSKFSDKKSAADYGRELMLQGIIDDFFVNNR